VKVTVRFFAHLKEEVGIECEQLELCAGSSINDLVEALRERYPSLRNDEKYLIAVNSVRSKLDRRLAEGDVIALLPPVSGG